MGMLLRFIVTGLGCFILPFLQNWKISLVLSALIPVMVIASISSLLGHGPFNVGPMQYWFSIKILLYSVTLMIGLKLRFIMREWTTLFRVLAEGPNQEAENQLEKSLALGKKLAYFYWVTIASVAFFGATKAI